jgi:hypothetical protein
MHTCHSQFDFKPPGLPTYNWIVTVRATCAACGFDASLSGDPAGGAAIVCQRPGCSRVDRYEDTKVGDVFQEVLRFAANRLPPQKQAPTDVEVPGR